MCVCVYRYITLFTRNHCLCTHTHTTIISRMLACSLWIKSLRTRITTPHICARSHITINQQLYSRIWWWCVDEMKSSYTEHILTAHARRARFHRIAFNTFLTNCRPIRFYNIGTANTTHTHYGLNTREMCVCVYAPCHMFT